MKRLLTLVAFFATVQASAQQVNPVPDYVFANRMSAGRNTVTDTAAYFSIGPRYGATRGMMPPMVVDTASFSANKRNGLLIFSVQKNKFLYWDSVGVKWAEMAGTGGSAITGSGVAGYMPEFTTTTNLDTTRLYHSAGRFAIGSTTTSNGVFNVYGGQSYFDTSMKVGSQTFIADEGKNEIYINTTTDLGSYSIQNSGNHWMSGNLTIGTDGGITSNLHRIEVSQDNPTRGILAYYTNGATSSQTGSQINLHQGNIGFWAFGQPAGANAFAFWQGRTRSADGTELVRITSDGKFGIGTNNPVERLSVSGTSDVKAEIATTSSGANANAAFRLKSATEGTYLFQTGNAVSGGLRIYDEVGGTTRLFINSSGEILINTTSDNGDFKLQVNGNAEIMGNIRTSAPPGGTANDWRLGTVATVSPTSPNRTIEVSIGGTIYYIAAKTTND